MKTHTSSLKRVVMVIAASGLFLLTGGSVLAQDATTQTSGETLQSRVAARKEVAQLKLNEAQQQQLLQRCKAAQPLVGRFANQNSQALVARTKAYETISTKLDEIITRLESQNVSTSELRNAKTVLATKIAEFNTDSEALASALKDTAELNCTGDPEGFKASLEVARSTQQKLRNDSDSIKDSIANGVRPALESIKTELQTKSTSRSTR